MDTNTPAPTTTTAPATDIPAAPAEKPSDLSQLERQLKSKPNLPAKTDYKNLSEIPDSAAVPTPSGVDVVPEKSVNDLLKMIEGKENTGPVEDKVEEVKEGDKEEAAPEIDLSFNDIDLLEEPKAEVEEKPKKKTKEDNLAELRKKAEAAEVEVKSRDEREAQLKKRIEELESTLERDAFEKSPAFQKEFKEPYDAAFNEAAEYAKEYAEDASIAEKALALKGKERISFIDEHFVSGAAAAKFMMKIEAVDEAQKKLANALENRSETKNFLESKQVVEKERMQKRLDSTFNNVLGHLSNKLDYFRKGDDENHNSIVDKRVQAARNIILGQASKNDMAVAPFLAVIAKDAIEENSKLKADLAKYKARVSKDASVSPSPKRGTSDTSESTGKPKGALDSIKSYFR